MPSMHAYPHAPALPELLQYRMAATSLVEHHMFCIIHAPIGMYAETHHSA